MPHLSARADPPELLPHRLPSSFTKHEDLAHWPVAGGMLALIWALLTVQIDPGKPPDLLQVRH